ncbi:hypothetical protein AHMF7605_11915 [Adhaeribacter arboris]|uniref:Uncharacterized protein n=1 Tax=Adhaeribacter arboris TaxID=2072846 RepID=A0A2T2YF92_9BACT|nr:hypothetical protein [Adhaeribacter arboris]PSR54177.1 hypothetical protein AHMF7605_11915 [Adhaeribacter arboris]
MKIKIEMEDRDALEMVTMLTALTQHLEELGNTNNALAGGIEVLQHKIFNALLKQVPPDRVTEICKR